MRDFAHFGFFWLKIEERKGRLVKGKGGGIQLWLNGLGFVSEDQRKIKNETALHS